MANTTHPECPKCNKGYLLPFYNSEGVNVYACTVCGRIFGVPNPSGHNQMGTIEQAIQWMEKRA